MFPALDRATSRFKNVRVPAGPVNLDPRPATGFSDSKVSQGGGAHTK